MPRDTHRELLGHNARTPTVLRKRLACTIEVSEFRTTSARYYINPRIWVSASGAVVSAFLHVALIAPVLWTGGHQIPPPPPRPEFGGSPGNAAKQIAMELIPINEHAPLETAPPILSSVHLIPLRTAVSFPELAVDLPAEVPASASSSDEDADSQLQGRYMGQINARIDRAWLRPRTPIGDARFRCQVRIEQDTEGNITELALELCNGGPHWQLSLIHAIESASPLPGPPDHSTFVHTIHMSFEAVPVNLAVSLDQYEPDS